VQMGPGFVNANNPRAYDHDDYDDTEIGLVVRREAHERGPDPEADPSIREQVSTRKGFHSRSAALFSCSGLLVGFGPLFTWTLYCIGLDCIGNTLLNAGSGDSRTSSGTRVARHASARAGRRGEWRSLLLPALSCDLHPWR
jgi:hypothetical protein